MVFSKKIALISFLFIFIGRTLCGQSNYDVIRLSFNTHAKELAPAFYQHGLVFCSDKRNDVLMSYTDLDNNPLTNLYQTEQKTPGKFENPKLMARELTTFLFEGPCSFSRDGKTIYFTRTIDVSAGFRNRQRKDTTFGIFSAELVNGEWTNLNQFPFNSDAFNTGYPFLSNDGQQLFFSSDAPGGIGGLDLYVSHLENGRWGKPENLGDIVNTPKNEVFPFLHNGGRLYFASRGHNQRGDLDIYFTVNLGGEWQKPVLLGEPINSANDDYGLILNTMADTGYFVTNRSGSPDIFAAYSTIPVFTDCPTQVEEEFCYVFYEPNNNELDTTAFAYEWDLGDGTIIRTLKAEHCFAKPDTYIIQLNIVDKLTKDVMLSQATYTLAVEKVQQPYIQAPDTARTNEEINIDATQTFLKDYTISNYYWDFGDGSRSSGIITKHRFAFPGVYEIILGIAGQHINAVASDQKSCVSRKIVVVNQKK
jgi:hypothetical protein